MAPAREVQVPEVPAAAPAPRETAPVPEPVAPAVAPAATADAADLMPIPDSTLADLVPIIDGDQETRMGDAPRPIDVDPSETGSFQRIEAKDGARVTTRANASQTASFRLENARPMEAVRMSSAGRPHVERHEAEVKTNKKVFVLLALAAVLVVGGTGWLISRALGSVDAEETPGEVEQTQVDPGKGIQYHDVTYMLTQQDTGIYALTSTSEGSEKPAVIYELKGTPVALVLYNTIFIVPENLPDGTWDLIAHPLGGGSVTQQVTDGSGQPIVRQGEITDARLSGSEILISTADGGSFTVSLESE